MVSSRNKEKVVKDPQKLTDFLDDWSQKINNPFVDMIEKKVKSAVGAEIRVMGGRLNNVEKQQDQIRENYLDRFDKICEIMKLNQEKSEAGILRLSNRVWAILLSIIIGFGATIAWAVIQSILKAKGII